MRGASMRETSLRATTNDFKFYLQLLKKCNLFQFFKIFKFQKIPKFSKI